MMLLFVVLRSQKPKPTPRTSAREYMLCFMVKFDAWHFGGGGGGGGDFVVVVLRSQKAKPAPTTSAREYTLHKRDAGCVTRNMHSLL